MRIEALYTLVAVVWLTAVLYPRLAAANNKEIPFRGHMSHWKLMKENARKMTTYEETDMIVQYESGENRLPVACCPVVDEIVEPIGGRTRDNMYVQLFRDDYHSQRFFEHSCRSDVLDKPCGFIERKSHNQSKCVQKFSYSYAIVENPEWRAEKEEHRHRHKDPMLATLAGDNSSSRRWTLDHIKVRSGCACEVQKEKKRRKLKKSKSKRQYLNSKP